MALAVAGSGPLKDFLSKPEVQEQFFTEYFKPWQAALLDSPEKRARYFVEEVGLGESGTRLKRDDGARRIRNAWHFMHTGTLLPESEFVRVHTCLHTCLHTYVL